MSYFGPKTKESALDTIKNWDNRSGSLPLLSEQIANMKDGPQSWSTTHSWPAVLTTLRSAGLINDLPSENFNGWRVPMTEITELGRELREHFAKLEQA